MRLTSFQRALVRRRTAVEPEESGGELNIVPFLDIVTNIIMFLLATTQVVIAMSAIDVHLSGRGEPLRPHALDLSLTVTADAVIVATADAQVATVRGRNWQQVSAVLGGVKADHPEETSVIISADPQIPYEDVVHAMDAARERDGQPLFPRVQLSAGVR